MHLRHILLLSTLLTFGCTGNSGDSGTSSEDCAGTDPVIVGTVTMIEDCTTDAGGTWIDVFIRNESQLGDDVSPGDANIDLDGPGEYSATVVAGYTYSIKAQGPFDDCWSEEILVEVPSCGTYEAEELHIDVD